MLQRKILRSVTAALLSLLILLPLAMPVSAAGPSLILKGVNSDAVTPILIQSERTFAPYDVLFTALGAEATYNSDLDTITATAGNTTVTIPMDGNITVDVAGTTYEMYSQATPIVSTEDGTIYIPIRYAAQALGYVVTWNGEAGTISLKPLQQLMDESGATYTVMNRVMAYNAAFIQKSHKLDGNFQLSADLSAIGAAMGTTTEETATVPLTVTGTASGLMDPGGTEMNVTLKTNLPDFTEELGSTATLTDADKAALEGLRNLDITLIVNNTTGMLYLKSPLFGTFAEVAPDTWISVDTAKYGMGSLSDMSGMGGATLYSSFSLSGLSATGTSFEDFVASILRDELYNGFGDVGETLTSINELFSDQAMVKDGDTYTVTRNMSTNSYGYTSDMALSLRFSFNGDSFAGLSASMKSSQSYSFGKEEATATSSEVSFSLDATGKGTLTLAYTTGDKSMLTLDVDYTYTETTQTPLREPTTGSTIVPIEDIKLKESTESDKTAA